MYTVKMISGGKICEFSRASGIFPTSLKGAASIDQTVTLASSAQLDGSFVQATRIERRTLTLTLQPLRRDAWKAFRRQLTELFPPHEPVRLVVSRDGSSRSISGYLNGRVEIEEGTGWVDKRVALTITCPQPFFEDEAEQEIAFRQIVPLFSFPLSSFVSESYNEITETNERTVAGTATGMMVTTDARYLVNNGEAEIGIRARIEAFAGPVVNPSISDGTRTVRALATLEVGDVLEISTVPGEKYVRLNGENYMFFDKSSIFFAMPKGVSEITVDADEGLDNARSAVYYRRKYGGV